MTPRPAHRSLGPVIAGLGGVELQSEERELLLHPLVGGVILFERNVGDREQLQRLVGEVKALRQPPLLVTVDQEGGRVQRLGQGLTTPLPALAAIGERYDEDPEAALGLAREHAWLMAAELRALGVDLSFAPVLDRRGPSRVIGKRALHADAECVAALGDAYVRGMSEAGMAATGKHFPGHGTVLADSHVELPVDERPWTELEHDELVPFARLSARLSAIMSAHVVYPDISARPAGFSPAWQARVLRGRLGFTGVTVSDDLSMVAAAAVGDVATGARAALGAGAELLLACQPRAVPPVLDGLRGRWAALSGRRLARLAARGKAPDWRALSADQRWQRARARLSALIGAAGDERPTAEGARDAVAERARHDA